MTPIDDSGEKSAIDATLVDWKDPRTVSVPIADIAMLAQFGCDYAFHGEPPCDEAEGIRGGCCNSCWAARFGRRVLKENDLEGLKPDGRNVWPR